METINAGAGVWLDTTGWGIPQQPISYHVYDPPGWYHGGPCKGTECSPPHPMAADQTEEPLGG